MITYSIIQKSQLEGAHRLDAEYYQPEYLEANNLIGHMKHTTLNEALSILTDYHANGSYELLRTHVQLKSQPDFALMIRAVDLEHDNFYDDVRYVSKDAYTFLKKSKMFGGEIIIDKIGHAGKVYLMPNLNVPVTLGMNLFMLRLRENLNSNFVYLFLTCKYGQRMISQRLTGTAPLSIDKDSVRSIKIPVFPKEIQDELGKLVNEVFDYKQKAILYYKQAENLLLEELGLADYKPEDELSYIVNFSDIKSANRMDAEFFQPKYDTLISKLKSQNSKLLEELVSMKKGFEPGSEVYQEEGKLFIRVSSLSKFGIDNVDQKYLSEDLYQKLKRDYEPQIGEILSTKDATPGIAYVLKEPIMGIISGGILRLKLKENIEAEYLSLCINSLIGQTQAERDAGGSVISHWKPEQIKNLLIPILSRETQQKIAELVRKSHEARKKSKELLEEAKRKVEEMIEKGQN